MFSENEISINSLAFQEQDSVLAACATTAIWSMLNKASVEFHTALKTPSQITRDADNMSPDGSRLFPNKGLNIQQICQAIFKSGFVTEVKQPDYIEKDNDGNITTSLISHQYLKKLINAYANIGIPIILVISVPSGDEYGLHAITISGYKKLAPKPIVPTDEISWMSDNIEKFYAHDDQWGPFVRVNFLENIIELETSWTKFHPANLPTFIKNVIITLYPKIRISYEDIEIIIWGLDFILSTYFKNKIKADLVWDIKLYYSENYKEEIKLKSNLKESEKLRILKKSYPRYIWIASCYISEFRIFDFLFDATNISNGMTGLEVVCFYEDLKKEIFKFLGLNKNNLESIFKHQSSIRYYQFCL